MKRRPLWLALPILLLAMALGVKWRIDHPTPTKKDLAVRALMSQSIEGVVTYYPFSPNSSNTFTDTLQPIDLQPFTESFYLSPPTPNSGFIPSGKSGSIVFTYFLRGQNVAISTRINVQVHRGEVVFSTSGQQEEFELHPVTVKRWLGLLRDHPRISPELKARSK